MSNFAAIETLEHWRKRRLAWLNGADKLLEQFWQSATIYDKLDCMIQLHEYGKAKFLELEKLKRSPNSLERIKQARNPGRLIHIKSDLNALMGAADLFIKIVAGSRDGNNTSGENFLDDVPDDFIQTIKARREIDPFYLPGQLPKHLSEPPLPKSGQKKEEVIKEFKKNRRLQTFRALGRGIVLKVNKQDTEAEVLPNAFTALREKYIENKKYDKLNPESSEYKNASYFRSQYLKYFGSTLEKNNFWPKDKQSKRDYKTVEYDDLAAREQYRVFISQGYFRKFVQDKDFLSAAEASTSRQRTHNKEGWAAFVITNKGELFASSHEEFLRHHSSFTQGAFVLYAGEFRINNNGELVEMNDYSGHYLPGLENMAAALDYFKAKNVDISACQLTLTQDDVKINASLFLEEFNKFKKEQGKISNQAEFKKQFVEHLQKLIAPETDIIDKSAIESVQVAEEDEEEREFREFQARMQKKEAERKKAAVVKNATVPLADTKKERPPEVNNPPLDEQQRIDYGKRLVLIEICDSYAHKLLGYADKIKHASDKNAAKADNESQTATLAEIVTIYEKINNLRKAITNSIEKKQPQQASVFAQAIEETINDLSKKSRDRPGALGKIATEARALLVNYNKLADQQIAADPRLENINSSAELNKLAELAKKDLSYGKDSFGIKTVSDAADASKKTGRKKIVKGIQSKYTSLRQDLRKLKQFLQKDLLKKQKEKVIADAVVNLDSSVAKPVLQKNKRRFEQVELAIKKLSDLFNAYYVVFDRVKLSEKGLRDYQKTKEKDVDNLLNCIDAIKADYQTLRKQVVTEKMLPNMMRQQFYGLEKKYEASSLKMEEYADKYYLDRELRNNIRENDDSQSKNAAR